MHPKYSYFVCQPAADSNTLRLHYILLNDSMIKALFPNILILRGVILLTYIALGTLWNGSCGAKNQSLVDS